MEHGGTRKEDESPQSHREHREKRNTEKKYFSLVPTFCVVKAQPPPGEQSLADLPRNRGRKKP